MITPKGVQFQTLGQKFIDAGSPAKYFQWPVADISIAG
jgi:hypothetical protein